MKIVFSMPEYKHYQRAFIYADNGCNSGGDLEIKKFPDGEIGLRILTPVKGEDVYFVASTWNNDVTMQIFDLCCAIAKYGARSLTLVVPYFGCSTMERAVKEGEVVTAKTRARLLSAIPQTPNGNHILLLDLHAEGIPHYFEGDMTATHVYAKSIIGAAIEKIVRAHLFPVTPIDLPVASKNRAWVTGNLDAVIKSNLKALKDSEGSVAGKYVLASTDAGRAKWVESLASDLAVPAAFIIKRRESGTNTKVLAVGGADVDKQIVVLYDDMIRTGSSLLNAAEAYRKAGATAVYAIATHGVLPGDSLFKLHDSKLLNSLTVTDSHPRALALKDQWVGHCSRNQRFKDEFFTVLESASLFVPFLKG